MPGTQHRVALVVQMRIRESFADGQHASQPHSISRSQLLPVIGRTGDSERPLELCRPPLLILLYSACTCAITVYRHRVSSRVLHYTRRDFSHCPLHALAGTSALAIARALQPSTAFILLIIPSNTAVHHVFSAYLLSLSHLRPAYPLLVHPGDGSLHECR